MWVGHLSGGYSADLLEGLWNIPLHLASPQGLKVPVRLCANESTSADQSPLSSREPPVALSLAQEDL